MKCIFIYQINNYFAVFLIKLKVLKLRDTSLSMIGLSAYFFQNIIRATILSDTGFYISLVVGSIGGINTVGTRAHFSKIVERKELGKVFSLMSALDSMAPLIASLIFTFVFNKTMDTWPGLCFIVTGSSLLIPIYVMMWISLYTKLPDFEAKHTENFGTVSKL